MSEEEPESEPAYFRETEPSGLLAEFLAVWRTVKGERPMPLRSDIKLERIGARLAPHVLIMEVEPEAETGRHRFRITLAGEAARALFTNGTPGAYLDEMETLRTHPLRDQILATFERVVETKTPQAYAGEFLGRDFRHYRYERIYCPVSDDGTRVTHLLGAVVVPGAASRAGQR